MFAPPATFAEDSAMSFQLTSSAFADGEEIPISHTCEGEDVSPPLRWTEPPEGTRSLALIVDDPDAPDPKAPRMTWVHWVVLGLPAGAGSLPEGVAQEALPGAGRFGRNDWKHAEYGGPCPPIGRHRYFHKLYALDVELAELKTPTKSELLEAMEGHVLAHTELVGTYQKQAP
jgi:Raf kinase inhibitor-like YbhB/YbcL family protein